MARKGQYLSQLICPYCHAKLILRGSYLICRYHKIGFEVLSFGVNFQWNSAEKTFKNISDSEPASGEDPQS